MLIITAHSTRGVRLLFVAEHVAAVTPSGDPDGSSHVWFAGSDDPLVTKEGLDWWEAELRKA